MFFCKDWPLDGCVWGTLWGQDSAPRSRAGGRSNVVAGQGPHWASSAGRGGRVPPGRERARLSRPPRSSHRLLRRSLFISSASSPSPPPLPPSPPLPPPPPTTSSSAAATASSCISLAWLCVALSDKDNVPALTPSPCLPSRVQRGGGGTAALSLSISSTFSFSSSPALG